MHIRDNPLIYSEIYIRTRRWNVRVFLCRHVCICVHVCASHPRAPRTSRYGMRSTFVELWPGNGDGATALCLAFDNRSPRCIWYTIDKTFRETKERKPLFWPRNDPRLSRAARFAILTILCRISRRFHFGDARCSRMRLETRNQFWLYEEDEIFSDYKKCKNQL